MLGKRKDKRERNRIAGVTARRVKTILVCLPVGVLLAVPIPFANTAVGYVPFVAYVFALVLMWVYLRILRRGLRYEQEGVGGGCLRGDQLAFKFVVENRSILPAVSLDVSSGCVSVWSS